MQKVLKHDLSAVQKHKATILECLKENDLTIKKLALDLLYLITNESNVKSIAKEMLNYLLIAEPDFIQDLTWKVAIYNSFDFIIIKLHPFFFFKDLHKHRKILPKSSLVHRHFVKSANSCRKLREG